jgi:hypothetical protein
MMRRAHGTALAYVNEEREVIPSPPPDAEIAARGLILLVAADQVPTRAQVQGH